MFRTIFHLGCFIGVFSSSISAHAWGRRGHALVCETASYLAAKENGDDVSFLKIHSFDLGYYCNVPDFIWKRPKTYDKERPNHYMNLEIFERELKSKKLVQLDAFKMSRKEFNKKHKNIATTSGRSWWRIQELYKALHKTTRELENKKLSKKQRHDLQAQWLVLVGVLGHYFGDLAMPLHVSENYDGQLTNQKGLHHHFEEKMVDTLYLRDDFGLQEAVFKQARQAWPNFKKGHKGKDPLSLAQELSRDSNSKVEKLLELDKKLGRSHLESAAQGFKELVVERLVQGSLYQAFIIHSVRDDIQFDEKKFYNFVEAPKFIEPPQ